MAGHRVINYRINLKSLYQSTSRIAVYYFRRNVLFGDENNTFRRFRFIHRNSETSPDMRVSEFIASLNRNNRNIRRQRLNRNKLIIGHRRNKFR